MPTSRRVKIVRVSRELLEEIFKQREDRQVVVVTGLPADARLVGISEETYFDFDQIGIKFESACWLPVEPGEPIPEVVLDIRSLGMVPVAKQGIPVR